MNKTINIGHQTIDFKYIEDSNCWLTKTHINNLEIDIEIVIDSRFHKEKEVDWIRFIDFYAFVNINGRLKKLVEDSNKLVSELGKAFFRDCLNETSDYKMVFNNSIFYNGQTDGNYIQNGHSYSLIFTYFAERQGGVDGDVYGNYLVDIENLIIVGARRIQC